MKYRINYEEKDEGDLTPEDKAYCGLVVTLGFIIDFARDDPASLESLKGQYLQLLGEAVFFKALALAQEKDADPYEIADKLILLFPGVLHPEIYAGN